MLAAVTCRPAVVAMFQMVGSVRLSYAVVHQPMLSIFHEPVSPYTCVFARPHCTMLEDEI